MNSADRRCPRLKRNRGESPYSIRISEARITLSVASRLVRKNGKLLPMRTFRFGSVVSSPLWRLRTSRVGCGRPGRSCVRTPSRTRGRCRRSSRGLLRYSDGAACPPGVVEDAQACRHAAARRPAVRQASPRLRYGTSAPLPATVRQPTVMAVCSVFPPAAPCPRTASSSQRTWMVSKGAEQ